MVTVVNVDGAYVAIMHGQIVKSHCGYVWTCVTAPHTNGWQKLQLVFKPRNWWSRITRKPREVAYVEASHSSGHIARSLDRGYTWVLANVL